MIDYSKLQFANHPGRRLRKMAAAGLLLGILGLAVLLPFVVCLKSAPQAAAPVINRNVGNTWTAYFRRGQFTADARTAANVIKFLLEPESGPACTNKVVQG